MNSGRCYGCQLITDIHTRSANINELMSNPQVVGIDLGTTFSLAAYVEDGRPVVVRDRTGTALVPSVISFHEDGTVLVGTAARERAL